MIVFNREELAWAAGFYDGEGHSGRSIHRRDRRCYPRMQIGQSDKEKPEVLIRFQKAVCGLGNISGPFNSPGRNLVNKPIEGCKPQWKWCAYNFEHVQAVAAMLYPFLSQPKRTQIYRMLTTTRFE